MARMYSRKRGQSGSHKPVLKESPSWVGYKAGEVEQLIVKLAKQEKSSSEIGLILRDSYGIPSVRALTEKKIVEILDEKKLTGDLPEDLSNLIKRHIVLMKHLESNRHDMVGKRGMQLTEAKIKRLVKYYKKKGTLEAKWLYNKKKAKLYVE
jgi:small subunit ribosomal protein S15